MRFLKTRTKFFEVFSQGNEIFRSFTLFGLFFDEKYQVYLIFKYFLMRLAWLTWSTLKKYTLSYKNRQIVAFRLF